MSKRVNMRFLAKWHIWLGWLVGLPVLMWTVTGLVMVATPIDEVRGSHLRLPLGEQALPPGNPAGIAFPISNPVQYTEKRVVMQRGRPVWLLTTTDGDIERYAADNGTDPLPPVDEDYVRALLAEQIVGGDNLVSLRLLDAENPASDFRRPIRAWQAELQDGARVYIDARSGEIAGIRTGFWRVFDFAWGLHIMDLETRSLDEQTPFKHIVLVLFAALSVIGSLIGCILMFRRRKARVKT